MSKEKEQGKFSDEENDGIAKASRRAASFGQDYIWILERTKVDLMKVALASISKDVIVGGVGYSHNQVIHEMDVLDEILRQSRMLLQIEGRDLMSDLNRHTENTFLGSVFDPESEITKRLKDKFGR